MTSIVEACCIGAEGTTVVDGSQGAVGKGEAEVENLFAALLLAWSCGLVAPDEQLQDAAAMQTAESDIVAGEVEAIGSASPLPEQVMAVSGGDTAAAGHLPAVEALSPDTSENTTVASSANEAGELMPAQGSADTSGAASVTSAAPETVLAASAVDEAGEQMPAQAFPDASAPASVASASNGSAPDDAVSPHLQQEQSGVAVEPNVPTSVHGWEVSPEPELPAELAGNAQLPELQAGTTALPEGSPVPVARASPADANTLAVAEETADSQGNVLPVEFGDATETESAPSGFAHTQARGEPVLMEAQRETQQDGSDLARGSGERTLQGNLAHTHAMRTPRIADGFDSTMSRVSDVSNAQLTQSIIDQTVRSVLLSVRDGSSELRVRLKPEHLGELHLRVVFKDNVLHLDVSTQSTVVKSVIESNLGQLRQSLDNSGLDTGRLSVTVDPDLSSGGDARRQAHAFQPSQNDWTTYHVDEEMSSDAVSRIARMRYAVGQLDLIA